VVLPKCVSAENLQDLWKEKLGAYHVRPRAQLIEIYRQWQTGQPSRVLSSGPNGLGKTRLFWELIHAAGLVPLDVSSPETENAKGGYLYLNGGTDLNKKQDFDKTLKPAFTRLIQWGKKHSRKPILFVSEVHFAHPLFFLWLLRLWGANSSPEVLTILDSNYGIKDSFQILETADDLKREFQAEIKIQCKRTNKDTNLVLRFPDFLQRNWIVFPALTNTELSGLIEQTWIRPLTGVVEGTEILQTYLYAHVRKLGSLRALFPNVSGHTPADFRHSVFSLPFFPSVPICVFVCVLSPLYRRFQSI
jgi:hypothetical protein